MRLEEGKNIYIYTKFYSRNLKWREALEDECNIKDNVKKNNGLIWQKT